jgi:hypothetical protein
MKKVIGVLLAVFFVSSAFAVGPIERIDKKAIEKMTVEQREVRINILQERITEIRDVPMKDLNMEARKDLRGELNYLKEEMKMHQNVTGIYISGAALIIIILLILLL